MTDATQTNSNQKIAQARSDFLASLSRCFGSPDGAAVLAWLHSTAATRKPAFRDGPAGSHLDPYAASFRDGRKSIVWEIEANLEAGRMDAGGTLKPAATRRASARRQGS
jgi:hypothetical protein